MDMIVDHASRWREVWLPLLCAMASRISFTMAIGVRTAVSGADHTFRT